jgi:GTPase SAR1 family protein
MATAAEPGQHAEIRRQVIAALALLDARAAEFELPKPPPALGALRRKIVDHNYLVLVAGEAKRGKSTFVNALIGRSVLPTDVDIATSQVFRVADAVQERYRLRFEDGSEQEIPFADLSRYGSQTAIDDQGAPRLDQLLRWIEVDLPIRFLPQEISLLDTPGLGSLYAAHSQITQRFVPQADAVIYVLDSSQPLGQPDIDFITRILEVTSHVFLIQTKIDAYRQQAWQDILRRNEAVLTERFPEQLAQARVWPISSRNLLEAAETGDEDFLAISGQPELAEALQRFLSRVAGSVRILDALAAAAAYQALGTEALEGRLAALAEKSGERRAGLEAEAQRRRKQFEENWQPNGRERQEIAAAIARVAATGKGAFESALAPGGEVESAARARIEALKSSEEAKQSTDVIFEQTIAAAVAQWQQVCRQSEQACQKLFEPFHVAADELSVPVTAGGPDAGRQKRQEIRTGMAGKVWRGGGKFLGYGLQAAYWTAELPIPLFVLATAGAAIWGLVRGWAGESKSQLKQAREELEAGLVNLMTENIRPYYFRSGLVSGGLSLVDAYFAALERAAAGYVDMMVAQKLAEAQAEADRLAEQARMDDRQRAARSAEIQRQLAEWQRIGSRFEELAVTIAAGESA